MADIVSSLAPEFTVSVPDRAELFRKPESAGTVILPNELTPDLICDVCVVQSPELAKVLLANCKVRLASELSSVCLKLI